MPTVYLDLVVEQRAKFNPLFESSDPQEVRDWLIRNIDAISTYAVLLGDSLTFVSGKEYLSFKDNPSEG